MDFPQFFQRPSRFQSITTRMFRGLTVLTQDPTRRDNETVQPVTGECFSDNDNPIHYIHKPLLSGGGTPVTGGAVLVAAKPGVRYFIHSFSISGKLIAADTTTQIYGTYTQKGVVNSVFCFIPVIPLVAGVVVNSGVVDVITDENSAIMGFCTTANPDKATILFTYSEVGGAT